MTKERAYEIASIHATFDFGDVSWYELENGTHLHIQTLREDGYYADTHYVTYIDIEDDNGDCMETHTEKPDNVEGVAFWIYEMCHDINELCDKE